MVIKVHPTDFIQRVGERRSGFVLLTSLIFMAAITLLVITFLTLSQEESRSSRRYADQMRAEFAVHAGFESVKSMLLDVTANDDYMVIATPNRTSYGLAWASDADENDQKGEVQKNDKGWTFVNSDNDPNQRAVTPYIFISRQDSSGDYLHIPLFAGGEVQSTTVHDAPIWKRSSSLANADGVLASMREQGFEGESFFHYGSEQLTRVALSEAYTSWIEPGNGDEKIRYTYWVEDLQGMPQPDLAGTTYRDGPNRYAPSSNANPDHNLFGANPAGVSFQISSIRDHRNAIVLGASNWDLRLGRRLVSRERREDEKQGWQFPIVSLDRDWQENPTAVQGLVDFPSPGLDTKEMMLCGQAGQFWIGDRVMWFSRDGRMLTSSTASAVAEDSTEHLWAIGLRPYAERSIIPYGMGYPGEGSRPANLNQLARSGVSTLSSYLSSNLPSNWESRKGGYSESYFDALAASMIDYMDEDQVPTVSSVLDTDAGDNFITPKIYYRGVEQLPMVTEHSLRYKWESTREDLDWTFPDGSIGPAWVVTFTVTPTVEFWNPVMPVDPRRDASGNSLKEPFNGRIGYVYADGPARPGRVPTNNAVANRFDIKLGDGIFSFDDTYDLPDGRLWYDFSSTPLDPNQYRVVEFDSVTHEFGVQPSGLPGDTGPPKADMRGHILSNGTGEPVFDWESNYIIVMEINGTEQVIDFGGGGIQSHNATFEYVDNQDQCYRSTHGNQSLYHYTTSGTTASTGFNLNASTVANPGDPFMSAFIQGNKQKMTSFAGNTLGARNFRNGSSSLNDEIHKEVNLEIWPDGGYNSITYDGRLYYDGHSVNDYDDDAAYYADFRTLGRKSTSNPEKTYTIPYSGFSALERPAGYDPFDPNPAAARPNLDSDDEKFYAVNITKAPFRVSNAGRFYSLAELGNIYDPIMWGSQPSANDDHEQDREDFRQWFDIDSNANPSTAQGGGNTLRIGRPEHFRFSDGNWDNRQTPQSDREEVPTPTAGTEAYMLLDILTVGTPGTPSTDITDATYHPDTHVLPQAPDDSSDTTNTGLYGDLLHAEGDLRLIRGHMNINTMAVGSMLLPFSRIPLSADQGYGTDRFLERFPKRAGWMFDTAIYYSRPFYTKSQLAETFARYDLLQMVTFGWSDDSRYIMDERFSGHWLGGRKAIPRMAGDPNADPGKNTPTGSPEGWPMNWNDNIKVDRQVGFDSIRNKTVYWDSVAETMVNAGNVLIEGAADPTLHPNENPGVRSYLPTGDALKEELFARVFNMTNLSSRHFRIHVAGETFRQRDKITGEPIPVARANRVYEVFVRPVRDDSGEIVSVQCEILSERAR